MRIWQLKQNKKLGILLVLTGNPLVLWTRRLLNRICAIKLKLLTLQTPLTIDSETPYLFYITRPCCVLPCCILIYSPTDGYSYSNSKKKTGLELNYLLERMHLSLIRVELGNQKTGTTSAHILRSINIITQTLTGASNTRLQKTSLHS